MSTVSRLASVPDASLALPPLTGGSGRPAWRRRAVLGLAVLVLAAAAVLVARNTAGPPGAGSTTAAPGAPGLQASSPRPAARAEPAGPPTSPAAAPRQPEARLAPDRVVAPRFAGALFAQHSWYVMPPAAPPPPPPPPPEPTAPPLPYAFVGSFAPGSDPPVYFLARGDRVIDAHIGDRLDGVYQLESAAGGQLVFVYLPLNVRQNLAAGVTK